MPGEPQQSSPNPAADAPAADPDRLGEAFP